MSSSVESSPRASSWREAAFAPVDIAPLVFFRIVLGALLFWHLLDFLLLDWIHVAYTRPDIHFGYPGLEWVRPWSGDGMLTHFAALTAAAVAVALGWCYRIASVVLFLGMSYVFLLDRALYNNHYYLIVLLTGFAAILPLHRAFSRDVRDRPPAQLDQVPAWMLWLLRGQVAVVYLFGALSKMNADWLLRGEPFGPHVAASLAANDSLSGLAGAFDSRGAWLAVSWAGMLFDLLIVPALLWRRSRLIAILLAFVFHALNSVLFHIGIFPLLAFCLTLLFLDPSWARRVLRMGSPADPARFAPTPPARRPWLWRALWAYAVLQILIPLRPYLHAGHPSWTEKGTRFAWRMMIARKDSSLQFFLQDGEGRPVDLDWRAMLSDDQYAVMAGDPGLIVQCARALRRQAEARGHEDVRVYAISLCALNGRPAQALVRPDVDLSRVDLDDDGWRLPLDETSDEEGA